MRNPRASSKAVFCSDHTSGTGLVSLVNDNPPGSSPVRIAWMISGASSVSQSNRAVNDTSSPISPARSEIDTGLPSLRAGDTRALVDKRLWGCLHTGIKHQFSLFSTAPFVAVRISPDKARYA